jgi:hypothetical protein
MTEYDDVVTNVAASLKRNRKPQNRYSEVDADPDPESAL